MKIILETIGLQTARGRLMFAALAHAAILMVPYSWLNNLSLYKAIGLGNMPSVGLTRSYWLLLHGQPAEAWLRNWLIFPILMVGWSIVALDLYKILLNNRSKNVAKLFDGK